MKFAVEMYAETVTWTSTLVLSCSSHSIYGLSRNTRRSSKYLRDF